MTTECRYLFITYKVTLIPEHFFIFVKNFNRTEFMFIIIVYYL